MKKYLGDSVYADYLSHTIVLTTENDYGARANIHLEPETLEAFMKYVEKVCSVKITVERVERESE